MSSVRNLDIDVHVSVGHRPLSLLLAIPRRSDADPSITANNDKKTKLSDENWIGPVTRKSLSLLNTCSVSLVKYVFGAKSDRVHLFNGWGTQVFKYYLDKSRKKNRHLCV